MTEKSILQIKADTKEAKSYNVYIGYGLNSYEIIEAVNNIDACKKVIVIYDSNVSEIIMKKIINLFHGFNVDLIKIRSSEKIKNLATIQKLSNKILKIGINRDSILVAVGGGVIGDIVGFLSAILLRGINLIHIPTTLLAQVDSSIGGKNGVNDALGKNLIGAIHQPKMVISDIDVLYSLPERQMIAAYSEILKKAIIADKEFFEFLCEHSFIKNYKDNNYLQYLIKKSCEIKKEIVEKDMLELKNHRYLLNLGHTFGHAIETYYGYSSAVLHGEAVGVGISMALRYSLFLGYVEENLVEKIENNLITNKLKTISSIKGKIKPIKFMQLIKKDKKNIRDDIRMILIKNVENCFLSTINKNNLLNFLDYNL